MGRGRFGCRSSCQATVGRENNKRTKGGREGRMTKRGERGRVEGPQERGGGRIGEKEEGREGGREGGRTYRCFSVSPQGRRGRRSGRSF